MRRERTLRRFAVAAAPAVLCWATVAGADSASAQVVGRFSAYASFGDGYSANPFLSEGDDTGSGYLEVTLAPSYQLLEPTASTILSANYRRSEYFRRYSSSESYGASLVHNRQLDARTSLNLSIGFDSSIQGERETFFAPPLAGEPQAPGSVPPPDTPQTGQPVVPDDILLPLDPTLIGRALRRDALNISGTFSTRPSTFDSYSLTLRASRVFTASPDAVDYRSYGQTLSYSRRLSDLVDIGARVSIERTDYLDARYPGAMTVQPLVTYGQKLSPSLSLNAAVGAVFVDSAGPRDTRSLSGNFSLCWFDPRSSLCLGADRSAGASSTGRVSKQLSGSLNYSYRLSPRDSISATINYGRSDQSELDVNQEYLNTTLAWNTQATQRLSGGASVAFRRSLNSLRSTSADVNGQVYLRMSFGP